MSGSPTAAAVLRNPFVGPRAIEGGEPIFGRDHEIDELYYLLSAERIVLLHSPSGAGKTSLIQAGLIPRLRNIFDVWGPTRVRLPVLQGGPAVVNRYVQSANLFFEAGVPEDRRRSLEQVSRMTLPEYVAGRPRRPSAPPNIILIFDQFEEVLTVSPLAFAAKQDFFTQLGELLQDPHVWALFALREDYLAPLDSYAALIPTQFKNRFRLDLLSRDAATDAISSLIEEGGRQLGFDEADPKKVTGVHALVSDLAGVRVQQPDGKFKTQTGRYVEPLHLQVACRELWQRLPADKTVLTPADLQLIGDVTTVLAEFYAREVERIAGGDAGKERRIRDWVGGNLITADGIRRQAQKGEQESEGLSNDLIERLISAHLVRREERANATWYELSHDRLIEPVRSDNRKWFEVHLSRLQKLAAIWEKEGRPESLLLLGPDLVEAQEWAKAHQLTGPEATFLDLSQAKQNAIAREKRLTRGLIVALVFAIGAVLATAAVAVFAYREMKRAAASEKRALTSEQTALKELASNAELNNQPDVALAYWSRLARANESFRDQVGRLLLTRDWWIPQSQFGPGSRMIAASLTADEKALVTASIDGTVSRWDVASGKEIKQFSRKEGSFEALSYGVFSADGRRLVTYVALAPRTQVWDTETGICFTLPFANDPDFTIHAVFSPDGKRFVTVSATGEAQVWDSETGKPVGVPLAVPGEPAKISSAVFSPDGKLVLAVYGDYARQWDASTGEPVGSVFVHKAIPEFPRTIHSAIYSPDGKLVLTASADHTAQLWDAHTGKKIGKSLQTADVVSYAAFSPDGTRLLTAARDGVADVWNAATGEPLGKPMLHYGIHSARFSSYGRRIITSNDQNNAQIWELGADNPDQELQNQSAIDYAVISDLHGIAILQSNGAFRTWRLDNSQWLADSLVGHRGGYLARDACLDACLEWADAVAGYRVNDSSTIVPIPFSERLRLIANFRQKYHLSPDQNVNSFLLDHISATKSKSR